MELLKEKILREGRALNDEVLKVDSFLNHQVDVNLMEEIGKSFFEYFKDKKINKIITIESSGIAPAYATAKYFNVPLVVCKKQKSKILTDDFYQTEVTSFTKNTSYELTISKKYLSENDNVLIIDDFLANGQACKRCAKGNRNGKCKCGSVLE